MQQQSCLPACDQLIWHILGC